MKCPRCNVEVQKQNIDVDADRAQCQKCQIIFKVSQYPEPVDPDATPFDMDHPPKGAWIRREAERIMIRATTRSRAAFFFVPFTLVWSGGSIGGIYGMQIVNGAFDPMLSLFGIPFLLGSAMLLALTFMSIWGKVELTVNSSGGKIFTGVGNMGLTREFTWNEVSAVKQVASTDPENESTSIVLEGKRKISFGIGLDENMRYYLYRVLKALLPK